MRPPLVVLAAAACLLLVTACSDGGESSSTPGEGNTALEGAELGEAVGSTEEVPFDDSVVDQGAQDAVDAPAVVLVPSDDGRKTIAARVTIQSATENPDGVEVEGVPKRDRAAVRVFEIKYRIEYVNGPVLRNFQTIYFALTSGDDVVSDDYDEFSAISDCQDFYTVRDFGKGAVLEGCDYLLVAPDRPAPDGVAWNAQVDGAPDPQVTWPLA